jgi:ABC-type multidrug transport system fused ATPase/permease subunit
LLQLSLEYFGGRRTGDLITRIGSESDRICTFLSLHLLDFATDVLMIAMATAILASIDPWLALTPLLPLPFIAWMIHVVRDRLRHGFDKTSRNRSADRVGVRPVASVAREDHASSIRRFSATDHPQGGAGRPESRRRHFRDECNSAGRRRPGNACRAGSRRQYRALNGIGNRLWITTLPHKPVLRAPISQGSMLAQSLRIQ